MIKSVTGTKDILPSEVSQWVFLEKLVREVFSTFNYKEIRTPIFEETPVFARGIGEDTDIVSKEMYTFLDRSQTSITLKPEMTAAVVRAFIEHSLGNHLSLNKLFYIAPMFRQEKPQAGRLRQFHQFGAEAIGSLAPLIDAELIVLAYSIFMKTGLKDFQLKINSLGTSSSREVYKNILHNYLKNRFDELSEESQKRFHKNILRIFDSKNDQDRKILENAPLITDYLDEESNLHFNDVKSILELNDIPFEVDPSLVRGLDYYTHTTFEIISGKVGAQSALCGGGRYDNLIEQLGGKPTPGVGFAAGIERLLLALENEGSKFPENSKLDVYFTILEKDKAIHVTRFANILRELSFKVDFDYLNRSIKAQMREANKFNAQYVVFVGGDEWNTDNLSVKNMTTGEQISVPIDASLTQLVSHISENRNVS